MTNTSKSDDTLMSHKEILGLALQLGFAVSVTAVLAIYGGYSLDQYFGTTPLLFWGGVILGFVGSLLLVWQIVKPLYRKFN